MARTGVVLEVRREEGEQEGRQDSSTQIPQASQIFCYFGTP